MEVLTNFFKRPFVKRLFVLVIIAFLLYLVKKQITLFLLTFILVYLINTAQKSIKSRLDGIVKINSKIIIIVIYLLLISLLFLIIYKFIPEIVREITDIVLSVTNYLTHYDLTTKTDNVILDYIFKYLKQIDIQKYIQNSGTMILSVVSSISSISINIIMAILLSLFFLLEKDKIEKFYHGFKNSKISWLYNELNYFGEKFTNTFGKVIQIQILISFINSVLSLIILAILGFPNIFGLFILIFVLGLIPVAGVIISVIPLSVIAYSVGGFKYIIITLVLGLVLHMLEAYILNPKLMSQKTKLPVFITFLILIMSEHIFGVWGLIVGIPITVFLLDILEAKPEK